MFLGIFKKVWFLWALCIIVNIIALLLVYFKISGQPEKTIVLHYNIILGVDNYGQANKLYIIPAVAFFLCSLNYFFFRLTKTTRVFYSPLLAGMSLIIQLVLLFALILIIRAN